MNSNLSIQQITQPLTSFLQRYHFVLFMVIAVGAMSLVVFMMSRTLTRATDIASVTQQSQTSFDQATIDRVNKLRTTTQQDALKFDSSRRSNPFTSFGR